MTAQRSTLWLIVKRLATSRSTYKLIGLLLAASGLAVGSDVLDSVTGVLCALAGGCTE